MTGTLESIDQSFFEELRRRALAEPDRLTLTMQDGREIEILATRAGVQSGEAETITVSYDVVDVLSPPDIRQRWLESKERTGRVNFEIR